MKIAIGPVFSKTDGPSRHIIGISKYSLNDVSEVPSKLIRRILMGRIKGDFRPQRERLYQQWIKYNHLLGLYDVVHSHIAPWFTKLCQNARSKSTKWVHTYHSMYFDEDYSTGCEEWQREVNRSLIEIASQADGRICISKWLHDILLENYSIDTTIIPNAYDSLVCENAEAQRFVDEYNIKDFILFVGHYGPIKNPEFFIRMASSMQDIPFVMMGTWGEEHKVRKAYGKPLPENLHVLGPVNHEVVLDAMAAARVFVMTSKREGIPTVLLEAMGLGKPVVGPNHSGCREVIHSKEYGFIYESESFDDLVEKMHLALESKNIGERAKQRAIEHFSWKVVAKQIDELYESLKS